MPVFSTKYNPNEFDVVELVSEMADKMNLMDGEIEALEDERDSLATQVQDLQTELDELRNQIADV